MLHTCTTKSYLYCILFFYLPFTKTRSRCVSIKRIILWYNQKAITRVVSLAIMLVSTATPSDMCLLWRGFAFNRVQTIPWLVIATSVNAALSPLFFRIYFHFLMLHIYTQLFSRLKLNFLCSFKSWQKLHLRHYNFPWIQLY